MPIRVFDLPPDGLVDGAVATETSVKTNFVEKTNRDSKSDVKSDVSVTETEHNPPNFSTPTEDNPAGNNPSGIRLSIRPKLAVNIMRVEFPLEIMDEINQEVDQRPHVFDRIGYGDKLLFPYENNEVGEQFSGILLKLATEYMKHIVGDIKYDANIQDMWTTHSYEGNYNHVHEHDTETSIGISCILYLKVPPQIDTPLLSPAGRSRNVSEINKGLNNSPGNVDGFTYLVWGTNGMKDINILKPITEEYVKPEVGMLIMFPSWVRHGVMPFFGEGELRTFSAIINIIPEHSLTENHYRKEHFG